MTTRFKYLRIVPALLVLALSALYSRPSQAQLCGTAALRGSYGYTVTGTIVSAVGVLTPGPFAAVGRLTFDGNGHVTTVRSLSDNGNVLQADAGTGTYLIKSDCTGSFNITVGPPSQTIVLNLNLVLDDTGELRALVTNPGIVLTLEGRPQFPILY